MTEDFEAYEQGLRDMAGMAAVVMGEGDSGYEKFDRWLGARKSGPAMSETEQELVEATARAIAEYQGVRYEGSLKEAWDGMARAALAVFEKAHDAEMRAAHKHIAELTVWKLRRKGEPPEAMVEDVAALAATVLPHGAKVIMPNGDVLVMNTDYPRPAFDVWDKGGEYQGHLYPHNVTEEYGESR